MEVGVFDWKSWMIFLGLFFWVRNILIWWKLLLVIGWLSGFCFDNIVFRFVWVFFIWVFFMEFYWIFVCYIFWMLIFSLIWKCFRIVWWIRYDGLFKLVCVWFLFFWNVLVRVFGKRMWICEVCFCWWWYLVCLLRFWVYLF